MAPGSVTDDKPPLHFHHIGVACRALDVEARPLLAMGYVQEAHDFVDPLQGIRGRFLVGPGPRLELLQPIDDSDTLNPFLAHGIKMYHQAFETPDLDAALAFFRARRARVVSPPKPAVAFAGRHVTFLSLPTLMIVELVQASPREEPR